MTAISSFDFKFIFGRLTLSGVVNTSDTNPVSGEFWGIQIVNNTQFSNLSEATATGSLSGTIPAGTWLIGNFQGYQLTSGQVRAYKI